MDFQIKILRFEDGEAYVLHRQVEASQSGQDGDPVFRPYGREETFHPQEVLGNSKKRWLTEISEPGWRRVWAIYQEEIIAATLELNGFELKSESHRVWLGMFVERRFRGHGMGKALLSHAINWARNQSAIDWIDLGVFAHNHAAHALYEKYNFKEQGRTQDRFRVDGISINDISMSLNVSSRVES